MNDLSARAEALETRLEALAARGVTIVDPRQTWVAPDVALDRIARGVVLHPGTRLSGPRLWLGADVEIGRTGPASVHDACFAEGAAIDSGTVEGAILLEGASLGPNAHVRPGTLLEEQASTAHGVGLKHTIVLSFVTLGSLINFCDCLMAGGTSRKDHSEVGSGYIHFNYTPWGATGDKATASLIGDVPSGVLLDQPRIFLGGSSGMVGPREVGFGAVAGAGQVMRRDLAANTLGLESNRSLTRAVKPGFLDPAGPRARRNVRYIGNLVALRAWYQHVRRPRADDPTVADAAIDLLGEAIAERVKRLCAFLEERGAPVPHFHEPTLRCPLDVSSDPELPHVAWVQSRDAAFKEAARDWLQQIVDGVGGT